MAKERSLIILIHISYHKILNLIESGRFSLESLVSTNLADNLHLFGNQNNGFLEMTNQGWFSLRDFPTNKETYQE